MKKPRRGTGPWRALWHSLRLLAGFPGDFLRAAAIPFPLSLLIGLGLGRLALLGGERSGAGPDPLILAAAVLGYLPLLLFFVAWNRRALLGPDKGRPPVFPKFDRRLGCVLIGGLALAIGFIVLAALLSALLIAFGALLVQLWPTAFAGDAVAQAFGAWAGLIAGLIALIVFCRLVFVLPAATLDRRISFKAAWGLSAGQGLSLFLATLVLLVPFAGLGLLLEVLAVTLTIGTGDAAAAALLGPGGPLLGGLQMVLQYIMTALLTGLFAFAYNTAVVETGS